MKNYLFFLGLALLVVALMPFSASAQDLIVLKNAQEIEAKVTAVSQTDISYRKWNNLDGPIYTLPINEVFYIKYENGEKEVISSAASGSSVSAVTPNNTVASVKEENKRTFSSRLNPERAGRVTFGGYASLKGCSGLYYGACADVTFGVNLFDYAYVGPHTSFEYFETISSKKDYDYFCVLTGLNARGYIPCNGKIYPFVDWTIGLAIPIDGSGEVFHNALMVGCDFSRFSLCTGWDYQGDLSAFCLKLGIRLGKN